MASNSGIPKNYPSIETSNEYYVGETRGFSTNESVSTCLMSLYTKL